ncbi:heavy metal-binding domain-containing protein [Hymenobacter sp. PAMC 26628]|uniref:heavy metal-binding domain-containing protein n=1 Tax=Hymenobacter sp. PAMC 26628 TaxID=1484118 RepID=UPI00076FEF8D|nr:heavy metal-binding domain-containing protein [Hymenobacter sp. PAMC 26628]AMJ66183.1 hypothetical protein AXW84_12625 [Hymenobacter sp. PAMC 26628]
MNKFLTYTLALASLTFATSCSDNKRINETTTTAPATTAAASDSTAAPAGMATQYTCPMHPEVVADQPGKCPKCGMDLVVKK